MLCRAAALLSAIAATLVLTLTLATTAQEPVGGEKKAVPDAAEQGKAESLIRKLFATKFKEAEGNKTAAQALAGELLSQGKATKDDDRLQFMAIKLASELAARPATTSWPWRPSRSWPRRSRWTPWT